MSGQGKVFGIVGAGVMGRTIAQGLLATGQLSPAQIWAGAKTQATCEAFTNETGIEAVRDYSNRLTKTDTLIVCVKPKHVKAALEDLSRWGISKQLVISIAAGARIADLESALPRTVPVVRAMPNTPCVVGAGFTAICGGRQASSEHVETAQWVFEALGLCLQLEEAHFDAVTSLGASGPAFIYLIMEALADGGVRVGLPRQTALQIVTQVVKGAASMVEQADRHPASLRDDVTTPAGCTIAGLLSMEDGKIRSVLARAVEEATRVASGLG